MCGPMQISTEPPELLTASEAARRLTVSVKTLTRYTEDGHLPVIVLPSGHRRYRIEDVDALLKPKPASA